MSTLERRFFSGDSLPQAVVTAARHYGLDPTQLAYRHIDKRHGFTKTRRRFVIEVDPLAPEKVAGKPAASAAPVASTAAASEWPAARAAPAVVAFESVAADASAPPSAAAGPGTATRDEPAAPATASASAAPRPRPAKGARVAAEGPEAEAVLEALRRICRLADLRLRASVYSCDGALEIDLDGEDCEVLAEENGEVLEALGYLVPRAARGLLDEMPVVRIDSAGLREVRESQLREQAERAAAEVLRSGQAQLLPRMTPAERRIVHLALAEMPGVATASEGDGFVKRVRVQPA